MSGVVTLYPKINKYFRLHYVAMTKNADFNKKKRKNVVKMPVTATVESEANEFLYMYAYMRVADIGGVLSYISCTRVWNFPSN